MTRCRVSRTGTTAPTPRAMLIAAMSMLLLFGAIAMPYRGVANDTRAGNDISIRSTERIQESIYILAGSVEFDGTAERDLNVIAGDATIDGTVRGTLHLAAGTSELGGTVEGSVYIASGRTRITGTVEGDVVMASGELELTSSGRIGGGLFVLSGQIDLRGTVEGDISGTVGRTTLGGITNGEVDLSTGEFSIINTARVNGEVTYTGRNNPNIDGSAVVTQGVTHEELDPWGGGDHPLGRASGNLLRSLWGLLAGVLLVLVAPRLADHLGANGRRTVRALVFGLIGVIAVPIAVLLLMVSVVGLSAGLVALATFLMLLYLSQVIVGLTIGRSILPKSWNDGSRGFHLLAMTLGVIVLSVTRFIPLPYLHGVISILVTLWGVGAALMLFWNRSTDPTTSF